MTLPFVVNKLFQTNIERCIAERGEVQFLIDVLSRKEIDHFWKKGWYPEAVWLLHRVDALCLNQHVPCAKEYAFIRNTPVFGQIETLSMGEREKNVKYYKLCRVTCKCCGMVLERTYKSPKDYGGGLMACTCGAFTFDPSPLWPRLIWTNDVDPTTDCEEYYEVEWE
ncbi:MAG: hypothetical protein IKB86_07085 [Clostridia bacterium]|nr:hypothetical protein [Clostridia bacterium]